MTAFDAAKAKEIEFKGGVNTPPDVILAQVEQNIRRGLPQACAHPPNDQTVVLVCGGPSLAMTEKDLVKEVWGDGVRGGKVVAVNGAYNWCLDRNIRPSAFVMLDAREFNARFVEAPVEGCHYLLSAQCHPRAFELCRDRKVTIWHAMTGDEAEKKILDDFYFGQHYPVTLGTTVSMRAISLLRMLGFRRFVIFGLDSCWIGDEHHAYAQPENSNERRMPVWIRPEGRDDLAQRFICSPWQAKQAEDFMELVRHRGDLFDLDVRGPGLIATMIRVAAQIQREGGEPTNILQISN